MYTITASTGNIIEIAYVSDYLPGVPQYSVTIDGETVAKAATITSLGRPMEANGKTVVGVLDIRAKGKKSGVGLTAETLAAIEAEADANRTDEQREHLRLSQVRSRRESLAMDIRIAMSEVVRDDLYESEYEHINLRRQAEAKSAEPRLKAARAALREFDVAHPEVLESIKTEEAASLERNRWM